MLAMGRSDEEASSCLRFSFGPTTTVGDIDQVARLLPDVVARARRAR
jgi:cysteine desulfurase